jgi:HTH-type transcriptional regulator, transcriptional repressor of NAD biosynthesis genes
MKIICVLGAESTGTTTLAEDLAAHYHASFVPEYGRIYFEKNKRLNDTWSTGEFIHIAREQNKLEDEVKKRASDIVICDTNAFATSLWHERYMGFISPDVLKETKNRIYDLYILTGDDIPFVPDSTRDGEKIRHTMHERFLSELRKQPVPFIVVSGSKKKRLNDAISTIGRLVTGV